jgi:hypothetical protein
MTPVAERIAGRKERAQHAAAVVDSAFVQVLRAETPPVLDERRRDAAPHPAPARAPERRFHRANGEAELRTRRGDH